MEALNKFSFKAPLSQILPSPKPALLFLADRNSVLFP